MKPVLVLDGHSLAALACTQALGRAGLEVHVASESGDALSWRSRFARRRLPQPAGAAAEGFVRWLREREGEVAYALVVPSTENSLLAMRTLPEDDSLRFRAVLPSDQALDTAIDKNRTRQLASSLGIPVPDAVLILSPNDIPPTPTLPVVLKPVRSKVLMDGRLVTPGAIVARREAARRAALESWLPWTPVEEQSYVPGRGFGLGLLYDRGRRVWHFAWRRVHELPLTGGGSTYRCSIAPPPGMLEASTRLLDALEWHGAVMVEFRATGDGRFFLMEINPRLWGSLALAIAAGVNFPLGLLQLAEGGPPDPQPGYRRGHHARSLPEDTEWFLLNLRADHSDPLLLTSSSARALGGLYRVLIGRECWDHFTPRDPRVGLAILGRVVGNIWRAAQGRLRRRTRVWALARRHRRIQADLAHRGPNVRLLFLCHGNICRSPAAAAFAKKLLPEHRIESAGLHREEGRRTPLSVREAAGAMGLDLSAHESRSLTPLQASQADVILLMDVDNYDGLLKQFPSAARKATLLGLFASDARCATIPDPLGATPDETRRVLEQIELSVHGLHHVLASGRA